LLRGVLERWLEATNSADAARLLELYAPMVQFYGAPMARKGAAARKRRVRANAPGMVESLVGEPAFIRQMHDHQRIEFTKRVSTRDKATDYQAYLIVSVDKEHASIIEESDRTTEIRLGTGDCEFVMWRTLEEFCGTNGFGVSGSVLEGSPEVAKASHYPEHLSSYVFAVGTSSTGGEVFHTFGRVRLSQDTGAAELECPSRWPWRWEHVCDNLARSGSPPNFYAVPFVPTMKPSDDSACAAVVQRLRQQPSSP
jgi:hypothetical protein